MKTPLTHTIQAVLQVNNLCFSHAKISLPPLFDPLSTSISSGVTWVLGGENSGKTTLLRLLAGDLTASTGHLSIHGISLHDQSAAYKAHVFWMDPRSNAFDQTTPTDYFKSLQGKYQKFDLALLAELIAGLSLTEHVDKAIYMLSAGSKRKVWLAAAFAAGATVTLLDEPFAALDMASIGFILELLNDAAQHSERAWVLADYEAPKGLALAGMIDLDMDQSFFIDEN